MRRLQLVAVALGLAGGLLLSQLSQPAHAQASVAAWQDNQYASHPPPTDAGQGLSLFGLQGWRLSVCADNAHAWVAGDGGTVEAYAYDYSRAAWQKSSSNLTETLSHNNTSCQLTDGGRGGCRCQVFEDREVLVSTGRVYYAVRGGVLVYMDAGTCCDGGANYQVQIQGVKR